MYNITITLIHFISLYHGVFLRFYIMMIILWCFEIADAPQMANLVYNCPRPPSSGQIEFVRFLVRDLNSYFKQK